MAPRAGVRQGKTEHPTRRNPDVTDSLPALREPAGILERRGQPSGVPHPMSQETN